MSSSKTPNLNASSDFEGDHFNSYDGTSHQAGPGRSYTVPEPEDKDSNLRYDLNQIISSAQSAIIKKTGIMAFHCIGDTGTDDSRHHNGLPYDRQDVANMMVAECSAGVGKPETPCFCYHVGDVIYPGSANSLYEEEFYQPYKHYKNAIVAIPGNHDAYAPDGLSAFAKNFMSPALVFKKGTRPYMNLPWYYWVLDTPVATIIGMAAISNNIPQHQHDWFKNEMNNADKNKALIVAVHYPPYCFDGSDNSAIRQCIDDAYDHGKRTPDLVLSGHSHNYQQITVPPDSVRDRPAYTVVVNGAGGVSVGGVRPWVDGNGGTLEAHNDTEFGALTVVVDSNKNEIRCQYSTAVAKHHKDAETKHLKPFTIGYNPRKMPS